MLQWLVQCGNNFCHSSELCSRNSVLVQSQPTLISALSTQLPVEPSDPDLEVKFRIHQKLHEFFEAYHAGKRLMKVTKAGDTAFRTVLVDESHLYLASAKGTKQFRFNDILAVQMGFDVKDPLPTVPPEAMDEYLLAHVRFTSGRCLRLVFPCAGQRTDFVFCLQALVLHSREVRNLTPPAPPAAVAKINELPEPAALSFPDCQSPGYVHSMAHHE